MVPSPTQGKGSTMASNGSGHGGVRVTAELVRAGAAALNGRNNCQVRAEIVTISSFPHTCMYMKENSKQSDVLIHAPHVSTDAFISSNENHSVCVEVLIV